MKSLVIVLHFLWFRSPGSRESLTQRPHEGFLLRLRSSFTQASRLPEEALPTSSSDRAEQQFRRLLGFLSRESRHLRRFGAVRDFRSGKARQTFWLQSRQQKHQQTKQCWQQRKLQQQCQEKHSQSIRQGTFLGK